MTQLLCKEEFKKTCVWDNEIITELDCLVKEKTAAI